jgi:two-component sensor histidine kinase/ActR/RegA family two-component response regulator
MAGRDAAQLAGMTLDQLLDADAADSAGGEASAPGLARLQRPDGGTRLVETTTAPVPRTRRNAAELIIATFHDITERKEAEERQALLAREVDHRAKNVLAIVQGVIRLAREPSSAEFADKIEGRIRALARAHELLARDHWEGTELVDLLRDELTPYRDGAKVPMRGPAVRIAAHAVQPLSMALHELATNAVKHGALKSAAGGLTISWLREAPDGGVVLNWEEHSDHPPKPGAEGTGLNILQASVDDLGGTLTLDWRDTGLACRIALPPDVLASGRHASGEPALQAARDGGRPECTATLSGARVMLVEDEVIVALDMKAMLEDLGCQVLGPASSLAAAQALASREAGRIDAALLDVNLKGETTLELARKLRAEGVACIFVTGYSVLPEAAEADWLLLQKPVTGGELAAALQLALGGAICQEKQTS